MKAIISQIIDRITEGDPDLRTKMKMAEKHLDLSLFTEEDLKEGPHALAEMVVGYLLIEFGREDLGGELPFEIQEVRRQQARTFFSMQGIRTMKEDANFQHDAQELFSFLCKAVVDYPEKVQVTVSRGEQTVVITIYSDARDAGKVIGKRGRTIDSMRTLLKAMSAKYGVRAVLLFDE